MNRKEIAATVQEALILLHQAQPGIGPLTQRKQARQAAHALFLSLPDRWWKKLPPKEAERVSQTLNNLT